VLLEVMRKYGVKNIIFSSSATVYGAPDVVPIKETAVVGRCTNPYGWTKYMNEVILTDATKADPELSVVLLRYFNPVGAHISGLIGESPNGIPNNLMPYISQVAVGKLAQLSVYGNDYPTPDGTGVRDYIHVVDLARAHLKAYERAAKVNGIEYYNVGTGNGYSVLDVVKAYEKATGLKVNYKIVDRRPGDVAECYADPSLAYNVLGWRAEYGIDDMCRDAANWQKQNPNGYDE
jgi:UDP-glucose 4-epimerase